jgi:uncharacterized DUF497 family protein
MIVEFDPDKDAANRQNHGALWTGIHVYRGDTVRFISVRRSNAGEQRAYQSDPGGRF